MSFVTDPGSIASIRFLVVGALAPVAVCTLAALVCRFNGRASAAARHLIWLAAFIVMAVCIPITAFGWKVTAAILPPRQTVTHKLEQEEPAPKSGDPLREGAVDHPAIPLSLSGPRAAPPISTAATHAVQRKPWNAVLTSLWAAGFLALSFAALAGRVRLGRIMKRSRRLEDGSIADLWAELCSRCSARPNPRLLISSEVTGPCLAGLLRPAVILPHTASEWPLQTLRIVLIHELAHATRQDLLCSAFARLVASFYWFNPLAWRCLKLLEFEAEMATDDSVVVVESEPIAYAETLVMLARNLRGNGGSLIPAAGMLRKHGIKARVERILDESRNRLAPRRAVRLGALLASALATACIMMIRPIAASQQPENEKKSAAAPGAVDPGTLIPVADHAPGFVENLFRAIEKKEFRRFHQILTDSFRHGPSLGEGGVSKMLNDVVIARKITIFGDLLIAFRQTTLGKDWQPSDELLAGLVKDERKDFIDVLLAHELKLERLDKLASDVSGGMAEWVKMRVSETQKLRSDITLLVKASGEGDLDSMRKLLDAGVDINGVADDHWSPLTKAAVKNRVPAVRLLLERGAQVDKPRFPGWDYTPLCLTKSVEIANALKDAGANIHATLFGRDVSILTYVARWAGPDLVQWFLDQGIDPKKTGDNDETLLFDAGNAMTMEIFLKRGLDPNRPNEFGITPITEAKDEKTVEILIKYGAKVSGLKPPLLPSMMQFGSAGGVAAVMEAGADQDAETLQRALIGAAHMDHDDIARVLLAHGAKANEKGAWGNSDDHKMLPLQVCCIFGSVKTARVLLEKGADPNAGDRPGELIQTALHNGHREVAKMLHEAGAKGVSDLVYATATRDAVKAAAILAAAPAYQDDPAFWDGALPAAARVGDIATVQSALSKGVPPIHGKDDAMAAAAGEGQHEAITLLLAARPGDADPKELSGALRTVLLNGHPYPEQRPAEAFEKTARLLLDAKVSVVSPTGENNLVSIAVFTRNPGGNARMIQMLVDAGADPNPIVYFYGSAEDAKSDSEKKGKTLLDKIREWTAKGGGLSLECVSLIEKLAADRTK